MAGLGSGVALGLYGVEDHSGRNVESDRRHTGGAGDQLGSCPFRSGRKRGWPDQRGRWEQRGEKFGER